MPLELSEQPPDMLLSLISSLGGDEPDIPENMRVFYGE